MKHRTIALAMAAALLLPLASCVKEADNRPADANGHFKTFALDVAEEPGGSKALISGLKTYWQNTDSVWINGDKKRIQVTNTGRALLTYVDNVPSNNHHFYAFFPTTLLGSDELVQNQFTFDDDLVQTTIVYPSRYSINGSSVNVGGNTQRGFSCRELPLVAMADSAASALVFEHLSTEVTIHLENLNSNAITIDSVVFMVNMLNDRIPLAGPGILTLDKTQPAGSRVANIRMDWVDGASSDRVTVGPPRGWGSIISNVGSNTSVSIPILVAPVGQITGVPCVTVYARDYRYHQRYVCTIYGEHRDYSFQAGSRINLPFKLRKDLLDDGAAGIPGLGTGSDLW